MRNSIIYSMLISICAGQVLASEHVIGRWCDPMIPLDPTYNREITIVIVDGVAHERSRFGDGSRLDNRLEEKGRDFFRVHDSPFGDAYRIESTGNLQLLDDEGVIRIAERLENKPHAGDCLK